MDSRRNFAFLVLLAFVGTIVAGSTGVQASHELETVQEKTATSLSTVQGLAGNGFSLLDIVFKATESFPIKCHGYLVLSPELMSLYPGPPPDSPEQLPRNLDLCTWFNQETGAAWGDIVLLNDELWAILTGTNQAGWNAVWLTHDTLWKGLHVVGMYLDEDGDGVGDSWTHDWQALAEQTIAAAADIDGDMLSNLEEFRWELVPVCIPITFPNCLDYDFDKWLDGDETWYWNDPRNDDSLLIGEFAALDPDRLLDTDGDGIRNVWDADSDGDGLLDGDEFYIYGSYPEFGDSDCSIAATACTHPKNDHSPYFGARLGDPGTGDGLNDADEVAAWNELLGEGSWAGNLDGDGLHNLLDPDSDGDGLLDGYEHLALGTHMGRFDTDNDGLLDGYDLLIPTSDPRYTTFTQAGIVHTDVAAGRLFRGELSAGTDPVDWDTDGDSMPDGWEAHYGLDPLNPADATLDPDNDGYNPTGQLPPPTPWTNLNEYRYGTPTDWSIAVDGVWWWGTDPTHPDSDGDGVLDGVEVHFGTDPTNGASRDPRHADVNGDGTEEVWRNDPTNEDLDELHPINQQYLENKEARAVAALNETAEGDETALLDFIADLADEALDLVWQQEVLDPLRPVVERVPYVQNVREAPLIVRGLPDTLQGVSDYVDRGVGILKPALMETVTSGSPQPLIDAADQIGPYLADAPLVSEALPAPLRRELQEVAVPAPDEIIADIEDLQSSPQTPVSEGLALTRALLPTTTPMPTFTADVLAMSSLTEVYHAMTTASQATGTPHPATVSDAPFYTVLVDHGGTLRIESPLQLGVPTSIDVDGDPSTGDPAGLDVEVELTLTTPAGPLQHGLPVLPGLRVTKLDPIESYEAALYAFVQIPGEETVAVLGVNQHALALNPANAAHADLPDDLWLRVTDYKPSMESDAFTAAGLRETRVGLAIQSALPEGRPVLVQAGLIPYDVSDLDKEPSPDEDHSIGLRLGAIPESTVLEVHDVSDDDANRLDVSWSASETLDLELVTVDKTDDAGLRQDVKFTSLPRSMSLSQITVRDSDERHVTYSADAAMEEMVFYSRHEDSVLGESRRVYVSVTDVPASFALDVVPAASHYQYTSSAPFTAAVVELSPTGTACYGTTAVHYLVMEDTGCTVARVRGLESFGADLLMGSSTASWTRTPDTGDLDVVVDGGSPFLLQASSWPSSGSFSLTDAAGAQDFTWTGSAAIADLFVTGDTRSDAGGVYYRFDVTDLPTSLTGSVDAENRVYDVEASAAITLVDFAYTTKSTREALSLATDFLAIDRGSNGVSVSGRIHGFKNAYVDLANGDLLHIDSDITTAQPLRVVYQGPDGAVDAYLSNVPQTVRFDYAYDAVGDRRVLDYEASAAITEAKLRGNLDDVFFDFHLQGLPTQAGFTADNTQHEWTVAANAPITRLDAVYVKNQGTYQAPTSGDYVVFYDEPTNSGVSSDTVVYAARLTGFQSATITGGEDEFTVASVRQAAQPFILRYGDGADYVEIDVTDLPTHLTATYTPGLLSYSASAPVSAMAFDVHLESPGTGVKILAIVENVPTELEASWPTTDLAPVHVELTHDGASPLGPARIEWWDLSANGGGLGVKPYLRVQADSIPDEVILDYDGATKNLTMHATQAGTPAMVVAPEVWSVPRGTATVEVPVADEYAVVHDAIDGRGPLLISFAGIQSVNAVLAPENGAWGRFHAMKQAGGSVHVEAWNEAQDTTTRILAANTPGQVDLVFRIDQPQTDGATTLQALDLKWRASAAIHDAFLHWETVDEERGVIKQATLSSPSIPTVLNTHYLADHFLRFDANAPLSLEGTFGPRDSTSYPARAGKDYAFVHTREGVSVVSVDLTGLENVTLNLKDQFAHLERSTNRDLELAVDLVDLTVGMVLEAPPSQVDVWWEQDDGRLLDYQASGPMDGLIFNLDALRDGELIVLQAVVEDLPAAVKVTNVAGGPFRVDTPLGGSIGDAYIEWGADGTGTVLPLLWTEGAVVVQNETGDVVQATARLVGLEDFWIHAAADTSSGTFELHTDLNRATSLAGESFGVHARTPQFTARATGTGLPEDVSLDIAKRADLDFLLNWDATATVADVFVETAQDGIVTNHVNAPNLPVAVFLEAKPQASGETKLTYTASAAVPEIEVRLQANGNQFNVHALDVPVELRGLVAPDYKDGRLWTVGLASVGRVDASFYALGGQPMARASDADEYFHVDVSGSTGKRAHVVVEDLMGAEWVFDDNAKSYGLSLQRGKMAAANTVEAILWLDAGTLALDVEGLPLSLTFGVDLDADAVSGHRFLDFVDPGDFLAAKWDASSPLASVAARFQPSGGDGKFVVEATDVPDFLELHMQSIANDGVTGTYESSGRIGSLHVNAVEQGKQINAYLEDAPTDLAFTLSGDKRIGSVEVVSGVGFGKLDLAFDDASRAAPALPRGLEAESFVVLDAKVAQDTALAASFTAGVDIQRVEWSKPVDSEEVKVIFDRNPLADTPSFAFHGEFPDLTLTAELSDLPSRIEYNSPEAAVHNARIEGGVASGTVHAVLAREAGVKDDLWVNVVGVPDWVQVNATVKELGQSNLKYRAGGALDAATIEGVYDGTRLDVVVEGLPLAFDVVNQAGAENGLRTTTGSLALPQGGKIGRIHAVLYPEGAAVTPPSAEEVLYVQSIADGGVRGELIYVDIANVAGASWNVKLPPDSSTCAGQEGFEVAATLQRSQPGRLHFLQEGDCGKYTDVRLDDAPADFGVEFRQGLVTYTTSGATGAIVAHVEGIDATGPDQRVVEKLDARLTGMNGGFQFRIEPGELVRISGGSIVDAIVNVHLGERVPEANPRDEPEIDLAVNLEIDHLRLTIANGAYSKVQNVPDSQLSIYQQEDAKYALYAELNAFKAARFIGSTDQLDPCKKKIDELVYETQFPNRDLTVAYDVEKKSHCRIQSGERERFVLELEGMPARIEIANSYIKAVTEIAPTRFTFDTMVILDTSSGELGKLRLRKPVGGPVNLNTVIEGIPQTSSTVLEFKRQGLAFHIMVAPTTGAVDHARFGLSSPHEGFGVALEMDNVDFTLQIDLDGHTREDGNPQYFFLDTGGEYSTLSFRIYSKDFGVGWNMAGIYADGMQVYRNKNFDIPFYSGVAEKILSIRANGYAIVEPNVKPVLGIEIKINDKWYRVPKPLEVLF